MMCSDINHRLCVITQAETCVYMVSVNEFSKIYMNIIISDEATEQCVHAVINVIFVLGGNVFACADCYHIFFSDLWEYYTLFSALCQVLFTFF